MTSAGHRSFTLKVTEPLNHLAVLHQASLRMSLSKWVTQPACSHPLHVWCKQALQWPCRASVETPQSPRCRSDLPVSPCAGWMDG